jgi:AcrR family transcriptional regulator
MVTSSRDPARTRERLLRAARREFVAKGFAGARVDAIARAASVNKRMLYHYFGDKEALYRAVLREGIATNLDLVAAAPADPDELLPFLFTRVLQRVDGIPTAPVGSARRGRA